jgi:hypothetical protein
MLVDSPRPRRTGALTSHTALWHAGPRVHAPVALRASTAKVTGVSATRAIRMPRRSPAGLSGLWERFSDDRDLFRLKIIALAALVALVAIIERAV